jgi:hypothetical protein
MPFNNPIVGAVTLIRDAIQSKGFVSLISGWRIEKNGDAEFNSLLLARGDFIAGSNLGPPNPPLEEAILSSGSQNPITGTAALVLLGEDATGRDTKLIAYVDPNNTGDIAIAGQIIGSTFAEMRFTDDFLGADGFRPHIGINTPIKFAASNGGAQLWPPLGVLESTFSTAATTNTTTEAKDGGVGNISFTAVLGRRYEIYYNALTISGAAANTCELRIRANNSAVSPTTGSTLMGIARHQFINAVAENMQPICNFDCTGTTNISNGTIADGLWTFGAFYASSSTLNVQVGSAGGTIPRQFVAKDVGGF